MNVLRKPDDANFPWKPILDDVENALREVGPDSEQFAVVWNGLRANQPHYWDFYLQSIRRTICVETPLIGRPGWAFAGPADRTFFRLGFHDTAALYGGYKIPAGVVGAERLDSILEKVGQKIEPPRNEGTHILYACQVPGDAGLKGFDPYEAAIYDLYQLRFATTRPLVCSVHPDCYVGWAKRGHADNQSFQRLQDYCRRAGVRLTTAEETSHQFFEDCFALVAKTSGITFEALLAGIRAVGLHPGNFCFPLVNYRLESIDDVPPPSARRRWFNKLAWIQWSREELRNGEALKHLLGL